MTNCCWLLAVMVVVVLLLLRATERWLCCVQWCSRPPAARCPLPLPTTAPTEGPIINAGTSREILSFTCGPDLHYYLPR
jgi:hypothetical protein